MSYCTANGRPVVRGTIARPRLGAWQAELLVNARADEADSFTGAIQIDLAGTTFQGTAYRSGPVRDAISVRIVGGKNGLGRTLTPKAYQNVPARIPIQDLCTEARETLSPRSDAAALGKLLPKWIRMEQVAGFALASLLLAAGSPTWRILEDGTLWVGTDTWEPVALQPYDLTHVEPSVGRIEIATDTPGALAPGLTFDGRRISYVEHRLEPDRIRHVLWPEDVARVG